MNCEKEYALLALHYITLLFGILAVGVAELFPLQEFEEDVRQFKLKVDDIDRRLGAIFCQAFDDAFGLEHAFKVWDLFLRHTHMHTPTRPNSHTCTHTHIIIKPFGISVVCRFWTCLAACWSAR